MTFSLITSTSFVGVSNPTSSAINCTGADLLVVAVDNFAAGTGLTDSQNNTWTQIGSFASGNAKFCSIYYVLGPSVSAAQTFKSNGSNIFTGVCVTAWSGSKGSGTNDQVNHAIVATNTTLAAGSITPTANNSLIIMALGSDAGTAQTISTGTIQQNAVFNGATNEGCAIAYFIQGTAAAFNPSWSWTTNANAVAIITNFLPAVAAPVLPPSTTAAFDIITRHWRVNITNVANGASSSVFSGRGYPIGEYALTGTKGVGGTAQWKGSNDGVNFVSIGSSITSLPASGLIASPDNGVYALYRLDATAGDATTSFNAIVDFSSQNMS